MAKTKAELEEAIQDKKDILEDASATADEKAFAKKKMAQYEEELAGLDKAPKAESAPVTKPASKKPAKAKKAKATKKAAPAKKSHHKPKEEAGAPSCDELIKKWEERRAKAKSSARKAKTASIFSKITDKVEGAVVQAIKNVPASDIKDNPGARIKEFEELSDSAKSFMTKFRAVLKDDYEKGEAEKAFADIEKLIEGLKKKYKE